MTQFAVTLSAVACCLAAAAEPRTFAKGYVRRAHPLLLGVEKITSGDKDRAPDAIDWVSKGATTPVKDQGGCGDCWAFSTTEGIESAVFMATGTLVGLSEQQLTSCVEEVDGCDGGDPKPALDYVMENGIDLQSDYPDSSPEDGDTGNCTWDGKKSATVTSYRYAIPVCNNGTCDKQDEEAMAAAVAKYGPLAICLNAGPWNNTEDWTTDDVVDFGDNCSSDADQMDHCVQVVGYDKTAVKPYWKIRNSWTSSWGENGFMRLPYGKNACGIANEVYIIKATSTNMPTTIVV